MKPYNLKEHYGNPTEFALTIAMRELRMKLLEYKMKFLMMKL